ncbi:cation acetate symporter [Kitasatospora atroaurantiaca]|uniref:SSS family solute:Na+ symporter/cation/acetate symporter n=1 Tax=Kitasatospora atroaurantiaca TaxID=285545 RepID=A0A561F1P6_9ACTN|nr:cation acetate symporter [Kitasatospora atroaurantiaca]TWE21784.1 SSS family solute:Na+ symporter/cation/acetate symporter [Kitasatospora atroaurantiaca]
MTPVSLDAGTPAVLIAFLVFVGGSLLLCVLVGPEGDQVSDFYTANRSLTPFQNGLALSGDYISAATLLGTTGIVALAGYDGFTLAFSTVLGLGVLLLLAQPMRNAGCYTLGDILELRARGAAPRIAAAVVTLAVSLPFLVVQLSGAGSATALLLGYTSDGAQQFCIALIGVLMVCYTLFGGMKGTGLMQIVKVVLTLGTVVAVVLSVLSRFHWDLDALLTAAGAGSGRPGAYLHPGLQFGNTVEGRLNFIGLQLTVVLGAACMPHMIMRVSAAPTGASARRSARYAVAIVGAFLLGVVLLGLGAAAIVGDQLIAAVNPNGQASLMLLAAGLHGGITTTAGSALFTVVACAVFVTVLAVVAGITLAAAAGLAHDLFANAVRRGRMSQAVEVRTVRWSVVAVGGVGILLAIAAQGYNVQFLSSLAVAVAASAVLPALVYSLFWKRYNRTGLLWTVYGGLLVAFGLQFFSPTVSGSAFALFPHTDFHWFPLQTPGLVSVPAAFLLGWYGTVRAERAGESVPPDVATEAEARVLLGTEAGQSNEPVGSMR